METRKTTLAEAGCIGVDAKAFGHGMQTLFLGMSEIFTSLGVDVSEYVVPPHSTEGKGKSKSKGKDKTAAEDTGGSTTEAEKDTTSAGETPASVSSSAPAELPDKADTTTDTAPTKFTRDDLTEAIVSKLKADRGNNEAIQRLLAANGVTKVSELQPEQFEAFMTALAQI